MQQIESSPTQVNQYLSFALGEEEYGIGILHVQEIKGYHAVTPIPNTPPHVKGVMNLRGTVIPIVDLRIKFAMEPRPYDKFTVVVVVTVGSRVAGIVVDAVSDVLDIPAAEILPPPDMGRRDLRFIQGIANSSGKILVLLDIQTLLAEDAAQTAEQLTTAEQETYAVHSPKMTGPQIRSTQPSLGDHHELV